MCCNRRTVFWPKNIDFLYGMSVAIIIWIMEITSVLEKNTVVKNNMIYTYRVDCWVSPKSGFDLAEKNKFLKKFKNALRDMLSENIPFQRALENFGKKYEGMVLESVIVETDKIYEDNEEEILSEIKKRYPGAVACSHTILKLVKS